MKTYNVLRLFVFSLVLLSLEGCVGFASISNLSEVSANETVVVAKIKLIYSNDDVSTSSNLVFQTEEGARQLYTDSNGYVIARLPKGKSWLQSFVTKLGFVTRSFNPNEIGWESNAAEYLYLGDIDINWHGAGAGATAASMIPVAGIFVAFALDKQGSYSFNVVNNISSAQDYFNKKYKTNRQLTARLISADNVKGQAKD